ncbi:hypothetical protein VCH24_63820 [Variovorax boronicumulans]|nr:hypothetical protein VCH24_63820 [Variovorax boronicumulans]
MTQPTSSLLDLFNLIQKKAPEYVDLLTSTDDAAFEQAFDALLEHAVHGLESSSKDFAPLDENGLTSVLALALAVPGLDIHREANSNGHVDLTIEFTYCYPLRKKLGEAKIYDGPEWHLKGLNQLLSRYTTGREGRGLLIAYVKKANIEGLIQKVRDKMDEDLPEQQQEATADHPSKWRFLSRHLHSCGAILEVGHVGCNLHLPNQ